jgi:hypothetical protein
VAKGQVDYFGRDRNWVRDCPGGGHGNVQIRGELIREDSSFGRLVSALLGLALIVGIAALLGSARPQNCSSRTPRMAKARLAST